MTPHMRLFVNFKGHFAEVLLWRMCLLKSRDVVSAAQSGHANAKSCGAFWLPEADRREHPGALVTHGV